MSSPVRLQRRVHCSAARPDVWRELAQTEHLNQFIGSAPLTVVPREEPGLARFTIRTKIGPVAVEYAEEPFRWVEGHFFAFRRVMNGGPTAEVDVRYEVRDRAEGGCEVEATFQSTPRFILFLPLVWFFTRRNIEGLVRYVRAIDEKLSRGAIVAHDRTPTDRALLKKLAVGLSPHHAPDLVARLLEHLDGTSDVDLRRIRPYELADGWGVAREDVLRLSLDAVHAGLLELSWALLCPSCNTAAQMLPSLTDLTDRAHCQACDIRFGIDLDRVVEATFTPHPQVRALDTRPFCIGGPRLTPHVVTQEVLPAGESCSVGAPPKCGRYRLFCRGGATAVVEVNDGGEAEPRTRVRGNAFDVAQLDVQPGAQIVVKGDDTPRHVKLERISWVAAAATAHDVTLLPEFRRHFGSQALRPGLVLSVGRVAVLFSDLCGSTALYSRVGDAGAFGIVSDTLKYCSEAVERRRGEVVKTMGDAVMAVFRSASDAVACAADMLEGFAAVLGPHPEAEGLDLKVGLWAGPCTIVSANGVLDYFGQTVNSASRVEHLAGAHEIVASQEIIDDAPEPAGRLTVVERFEARVKGIDEPLSLVRLTTTRPSAG